MQHRLQLEGHFGAGAMKQSLLSHKRCMEWSHQLLD